ncbi:hypothetical protein R9C00_04995 [Flammeovirgaceae bacterium SG7u.111]|nr:hypothetical protein [Flammeovirgaceae bacterium SG7u.132]WPO36801.1 hypothetical protein R9C00_04995 [Flammeovirgaceae bacterium SG7u.111]
MQEQDLRSIWNSSSSSVQISIEHAQLAEELNGKLSSIHNKIQKRDLWEILASVLGILIYSCFLYFFSPPLQKIACALTIVWFVFIIYRFYKSKKQAVKPNFTMPLTEQLMQQKTILISQMKLLGTVAYWYVLPPLLFNTLFIFGSDDFSEYNWGNGMADKVFILVLIGIKIMILAIISAFCIYIVRMNKRAANDLQPFVDNIERLQEQLEMDK